MSVKAIAECVSVQPRTKRVNNAPYGEKDSYLKSLKNVLMETAPFENSDTSVRTLLKKFNCLEILWDAVYDAKVCHHVCKHFTHMW